MASSASSSPERLKTAPRPQERAMSRMSPKSVESNGRDEVRCSALRCALVRGITQKQARGILSTEKRREDGVSGTSGHPDLRDFKITNIRSNRYVPSILKPRYTFQNRFRALQRKKYLRLIPSSTSPQNIGAILVSACLPLALKSRYTSTRQTASSARSSSKQQQNQHR